MESVDLTVAGEAAPFIIPVEDSFEATEYSVSGWFKFKLSDDETRASCHMAFRLANNGADSLTNSDRLGDRTLAAFQCSDIQLTTYKIGSIDADFNANVMSGVTSGEYTGLWTYIFMGYSRFFRSVRWYVGYPDTSLNGVMTEVVHYAPKHLALYLGNDGVADGWGGKAKFVTINIGTGAYKDTSMVNVEHTLPNYFSNTL